MKKSNVILVIITLVLIMSSCAKSYCPYRPPSKKSNVWR